MWIREENGQSQGPKTMVNITDTYIKKTIIKFKIFALHIISLTFHNIKISK